MSALCYPYGGSISCMCDNRGRIYRCVAQVDTIHNVGQDPDPVLDQTLVHDSPSDPSQTLDERTEVILAATFLVLVVLTFVAFVIYRCERTYTRRTLQVGILRKGKYSTLSTSRLFLVVTQESLYANSSRPCSSVSVQTDPEMGVNGVAVGMTTISRIVSNGGTHITRDCLHGDSHLARDCLQLDTDNHRVSGTWNFFFWG